MYNTAPPEFTPVTMPWGLEKVALALIDEFENPADAEPAYAENPAEMYPALMLSCEEKI
jgi:hypothetical protein